MSIETGCLCVRGLAKAEVLERLGLEEAGETGAWIDFDLSGGEMPGGWVVVVTPYGDLPARPLLEALSANGEVLACEVHEGVMHSRAQGFSAGRFVWSVEHDVGRKAGIYDLTPEGEPPPAFAEIKARLVARQDEKGGKDAGTDYIFDGPAELVYALCGFRADGADMPDEPTMTSLEKAGGAAASGPGAGKSWLARLFGRR